MDTNIKEKYGSLTVLEKVRVPLKNDLNHYKTWAKCRCDCGGEIFTMMNRLRTGNTKSCGCLPRKKPTHGLSQSKIYRVWCAMHNRCYNQNQNSYKNYGAIGITVCDEWRNPKTFINWAFQNGYKDGLSIDRINNRGNYEPSNCRFTNDITQANNKRNNVILELNGVKHSVCDWGRLTGLRSATIIARIRRCGWSVEKALNHPLR